MRVVVAGIDVVEHGGAGSSRPNQPAAFFRAASDCAAASSGVVRGSGTCSADRQRIRSSRFAGRRLARAARVVDRGAFYSHVSSRSGSVERVEQAFRNSLYAAVVHRADACDVATGFHGFSTRNGGHARAALLFCAHAGNSSGCGSRPKAPITNLNGGAANRPRGAGRENFSATDWKDRVPLWVRRGMRNAKAGRGAARMYMWQGVPL